MSGGTLFDGNQAPNLLPRRIALETFLSETLFRIACTGVAHTNRNVCLYCTWVCECTKRALDGRYSIFFTKKSFEEKVFGKKAKPKLTTLWRRTTNIITISPSPFLYMNVNWHIFWIYLRSVYVRKALLIPPSAEQNVRRVSVACLLFPIRNVMYYILFQHMRSLVSGKPLICNINGRFIFAIRWTRQREKTPTQRTSTLQWRGA